MSEGKGGHKKGNKLKRGLSKLKCSGGSAVEVDDTAHKPMDAHNRRHNETSKGTNSKQGSSSELFNPRAPSAHRSYFSDDYRVHHERNQDNGHLHATSPAGPNSDSPVGWPLQTIQLQQLPSHQRNLEPEFEQEQEGCQQQPEPGFENRALAYPRHAKFNIGVHNGSQRFTPAETPKSVQGHPGGSYADDGTHNGSQRFTPAETQKSVQGHTGGSYADDGTHIGSQRFTPAETQKSVQGHTGGFYADDGTGPSPKILLTSFAGVKEALNNFTKHYIASMKGDMAEWEVLEEFIKKDVTVKTSRANHWKFVVQAYISSRLFEGFDKQDYGLDGIQDYTEVECFQQFRDCNDKVETISRLLSTNIPADSFLSKFCFQKYKRVVENPLTKEPFLSHNLDWKDTEDGRHPNTIFYRSFVKVALSVWLLHRLRFSFLQKCTSNKILKGDGFNTMCMESVVPYCAGEGDEDDVTDQKGGENSQNLVVGFTVLPGLQVSEAVVKSEVYLVRAEELDKAVADAGKSSILDELPPEDSSDGHTDCASLEGVQEDASSSPLQQNNRSSNEQIPNPAELMEGEPKRSSHGKKKGHKERLHYMEPTVSSKLKKSPTVHK